MSQPSDTPSVSDFWHEQIHQWQASGLSGAQFCRDHALNYAQFMYWRKKSQTPDNPVPSNGVSGFSRVTRQAVSPATSLSITLPNGVVIQGVDAQNMSLVRQLLEGAL